MNMRADLERNVTPIEQCQSRNSLLTSASGNHVLFDRIRWDQYSAALPPKATRVLPSLIRQISGRGMIRERTPRMSVHFPVPWGTWRRDRTAEDYVP